MKMSLLMLGIVLAGCAMLEAPERTLRPPAGASPAVAVFMEEGNRLFKARQWDAAKAQYESAVKAQPTLAEAHYNLGMALYAMRNDVAARRHFVEAANLAPGDKVIWDAPLLRRHGEVEGRSKSGSFITPAMGVH